jgi:hypothetical protein
MAKSETIKIGIGDEVIELTGEALEAFLADRAAIQAEAEAQAEAQAEARALKVSAYTKLGLTEDEINAIIGAQ